MSRYECWVERWFDLDRDDKIAIYNDWADDWISKLDRYSIGDLFTSVEDLYDAIMDGVDLNDDFIVYNNGWESYSSYGIERFVDDCRDDIYECERAWEDYIDMSEYDPRTDALRLIAGSSALSAEAKAVLPSLDFPWDGDMSDSYNLRKVAEWWEGINSATSNAGKNKKEV